MACGVVVSLNHLLHPLLNVLEYVLAVVAKCQYCFYLFYRLIRSVRVGVVECHVEGDMMTPFSLLGCWGGREGVILVP